MVPEVEPHTGVYGAPIHPLASPAASTAPRSERGWVERPIVTRPTLVDSSTEAGATVLYTVPANTRLVRLSGLTVTNPRSYTETLYIYVGIMREDDATTTTWEPLIAPYLGGGGSATWSGALYMSAGDSLVAYANVADYATVSFGLEDISP